MKHHTRPVETVDEAIDRVAAAMTAVPADPMFADRLVHHINDRRGWVWTLIPAAAAIGAIALAIAWTVSPRPTPPASPVAAAPQIAPDVTPAPGAPVIQEAANTRAPRSRVRPLSQTPPVHDESPVPQIAALQDVSGIAFEDLSNDLLTIAPMQVAPLDLASLEIVDMKGDDPPREP